MIQIGINQIIALFFSNEWKMPREFRQLEVSVENTPFWFIRRSKARSSSKCKSNRIK